MDVYIIRVVKCGSAGVNVQVDTSSDKKSYFSSPFLEHALSVRVPTIHGISLSLNGELHKSLKSPASWKVLNTDGTSNRLKIDEHTVEANQDDVSKVLMDISDKLPLPGSYLLHILFDFREWDLLNVPVSMGVTGAIKKLCSWHLGRLVVYSNCEPSSDTQSLFNFMDSDFQFYKCQAGCDAVYSLSLREIWRGRFSALQNDMKFADVNGFTMYTVKDDIDNSITVDNVSPRLPDSCEDVNVWIGPEIHILSVVDVCTVPLTYYTGRKFLLRYNIDGRYPERNKALDIIRQFLHRKPVAAYLCRLQYSVSDKQYHSLAKHSSDHWREAIVKEFQTPDVLIAKRDQSHLHFMFRLSQNTGSSDNSIDFTCHILSRVEEQDLRIPCNYSCDPVSFLGDSFQSFSTMSSEPTTFESVDVTSLLNRYTLFKFHANELFREWLGSRASAGISCVEFQSLVDQCMQHISAEITKSWKRCTESPDSPEGDSHHVLNVYKVQKGILENVETVRNAAKRDDANSPVVLDMHFKPDDILRHFSHQESLCDYSLGLLTPKTDLSALPSWESLQNFDEARQQPVFYHGIMFNNDEIEADKDEKACRRWIEKYVKFETRSLGSIARVPSHSIIPAGRSPAKKILRVRKTSSKSVNDENHLKKVAEKLHKKRVEKRKFSSQLAIKPACTMVLRSTPVKTKPTRVDSNSDKGPAKDQKRLLRKSYVRDNKKRLEDMIESALSANGVPRENKRYESCFRRLYQVSMAFLKDLKSSKNLDQIMKDTVYNNVQSVVSFQV